eukprot:1993219-Amphidinium_carterae.1
MPARETAFESNGELLSLECAWRIIVPCVPYQCHMLQQALDAEPAAACLPRAAGQLSDQFSKQSHATM